jgi:putative membrane protein
MTGGTTAVTWLPYCGAAPVPDEWLARWNGDPLLLAAFAAAGAWWWWRLPPRDSRLPLGIAAILLAILFVSPFCALTSALFAARTAHHALLIVVVAPLLVLAMPPARLPRAAVGGWTALHAVVLWAWHFPPLYAAALSHDGIYWLMQASLLGSAVLFWGSVRGAPITLAVGALLATMVQMGLLGALLTFTGKPLYAPHWLTTSAWGLTPLEDQQLGGLIMWAPAGAVYLAAALLLAGRWLRNERRASA